MKIIISPAKKMKINNHLMGFESRVVFKDRAEILKNYIKNLTYEEAQNMWKCNDKIATENFHRFMNMELDKNLTPAILAYEGIQYKYMGSEVFSTGEYEYLQEHLRILSGFYGVLKPFDGVTPYRLEMQSKISLNYDGKEIKTLYKFWKDELYKEIIKDWTGDGGIIVNLASEEYSKVISSYIKNPVKMVNCNFLEKVVKNGVEKLVIKATEAKMARGTMVRFMAENKVEDIEKLKDFNYLGFTYNDSISDCENYNFVKEN